MDVLLRVSPQGTVSVIYDDELAPLIGELGRASIQRASYVEPTSDGWWLVDLTPSNGPVLGPFPLRNEALAAERAWLERRTTPPLAEVA
ncbi:MAG: hypothetical protein AB1411_15735 [Nitrospirota bacterium]